MAAPSSNASLLRRMPVASWLLPAGAGVQAPMTSIIARAAAGVPGGRMSLAADAEVGDGRTEPIDQVLGRQVHVHAARAAADGHHVSLQRLCVKQYRQRARGT